MCAGELDVIRAIERLRALRAGTPLTAVMRPCPRDVLAEDLPAFWRELYDKRAAIREFHGGQAREHAEAEALAEVVGRMRAAGSWSTGANTGDEGEP